jgi:hypothetical protein
VHRDIAFLHTSSDAYAEEIKKKQTTNISPRTKYFFIFYLLSQLKKQKAYHRMLFKQKTLSPQEKKKKKARQVGRPYIYLLPLFTPQ